MKIPVSLSAQKENRDVVSNDMDYVIGKLQGKLIVESRKSRHSPHKLRPSPYCVPQRNTSENQVHNGTILTKCPKCFSRNCTCSDERHMDSVTLIKKLLEEQTLIQEAVRRIQSQNLSMNCDDRSSLSLKSRKNEEASENLRNTSYESEEEWELVDA